MPNAPNQQSPEQHADARHATDRTGDDQGGKGWPVAHWDPEQDGQAKRQQAVRAKRIHNHIRPRKRIGKQKKSGERIPAQQPGERRHGLQFNYRAGGCHT
jgi:hypothetical protein